MHPRGLPPFSNVYVVQATERKKVVVMKERSKPVFIIETTTTTFQFDYCLVHIITIYQMTVLSLFLLSIRLSRIKQKNISFIDIDEKFTVNSDYTVLLNIK